MNTFVPKSFSHSFRRAVNSIKMAGVTIFLAYPFIAQTMFQFFACRKLDEATELLSADYQINCADPFYENMMPIGVLCVLLFPIGLPVLGLALVLRKGESLLESGRFAFITSDYKLKFFWWEATEMVSNASADCFTILAPHLSHTRSCFSQLRKTLLTGGEQRNR